MENFTSLECMCGKELHRDTSLRGACALLLAQHVTSLLGDVQSFHLKGHALQYVSVRYMWKDNSNSLSHLYNLGLRETTLLELFFSSLGGYAPKRISYRWMLLKFFAVDHPWILSLYCFTTTQINSTTFLIISLRWEAFRGRVIAAAIDHNLHLDRRTLTRSNGSVRYHRKWSSRSKRWYVSPVKTKKTYGYVPAMMARVLLQYSRSSQPLRRRLVLSQDHPRHIANTIANSDPKNTSIIAAEQISRQSQKYSSLNVSDVVCGKWSCFHWSAIEWYVYKLVCNTFFLFHFRQTCLLYAAARSPNAQPVPNQLHRSAIYGMPVWWTTDSH